jgi:hypothetical protein
MVRHEIEQPDLIVNGGRLMKKRGFLFILCAIILCVSQISQAATREEVAGIKVVRAGDFRYWTADSPAKAALVSMLRP